MRFSDRSTNVVILPEPGRTIVRNGPATWARMSGCCEFMCLMWRETVWESIGHPSRSRTKYLVRW